jgi:hypothetical protein
LALALFWLSWRFSPSSASDSFASRPKRRTRKLVVGFACEGERICQPTFAFWTLVLMRDWTGLFGFSFRKSFLAFQTLSKKFKLFFCFVFASSLFQTNTLYCRGILLAFSWGTFLIFKIVVDKNLKIAKFQQKFEFGKFNVGFV